MRRILAAVFGVFLSLGLGAPCSAAPPGARSFIVVLVADSGQAVVGGAPASLDQPPVFANGRLLVPVRFVAEALGATVGWDADARQVDVTLGDKHVSLWIDQPKAQVGGSQVTLDAPPRIVGGRTLVPLRFVAEALDADVAWNVETRAVTIHAYPPDRSRLGGDWTCAETQQSVGGAGLIWYDGCAGLPTLHLGPDGTYRLGTFTGSFSVDGAAISFLGDHGITSPWGAEAGLDSKGSLDFGFAVGQVNMLYTYRRR